MGTAIRRIFTIATAALLLATMPAMAGEVTVSIRIGAAERSYLMVTPAGAGRGPFPVVVALHGALMDGRAMRRTFGLDDVADREEFVAVYPDGLGRRWNDGRRQPWRRRSESVDDVAFLTRLARRLIDEGIADPDRLYLVGASNGGMMVFRMACEAPAIFTAYAAIIANMPIRLAKSCRPGRGVPMLIMNATKDPLVPWDGGPLGFGGRYGQLVSTEESLAFWQRNNGCDGPRQKRPLPDKDRKDGSTVMAEQYNKCKSGAPVVLITVAGGGHLPPGATLVARPLIEGILGKGNRDISAAEISWKFFRRFPVDEER